MGIEIGKIEFIASVEGIEKGGFMDRERVQNKNYDMFISLLYSMILYNKYQKNIYTTVCL